MTKMQRISSVVLALIMAVSLGTAQLVSAEEYVTIPDDTEAVSETISDIISDEITADTSVISDAETSENSENAETSTDIANIADSSEDVAITTASEEETQSVNYWTIYISSPQVNIKYDDRYSFEATVTHIENLTVASHQTNNQAALDTAVLRADTYSSNKVVACGCGTAVVTLSNGLNYGVNVTAAPISLLFIAGQSNAEGRPAYTTQLSTYKQQYIVNQEGQVYNTYAPAERSMFAAIGWYGMDSNPLSIANAQTDFIPDSLTDNSSTATYKRTNNLTNASGACGKSGIDSALAYEWVKLTGEKVWIVNAAHRGSSITTWQPTASMTDNNYWQAVLLYQRAQAVLNNEISAGHYILSHKGIFWLQGEEDKSMSASVYLKYFNAMNNGFNQQLGNINFTGVLMVRANNTHNTKNDLLMTGPRQALYYATTTNNSAYANVYLASQAEEDWTTNAGVANYFRTKYGSVENYNALSPSKSSYNALPNDVAQIHQVVHYSQLAYNELGLDSADNICYALGYAAAPTNQVSRITLVTDNGYTNRANKTFTVKRNKTVAFTAKVYPTYLSKGTSITSNSKYLKYTSSGIKVTKKNKKTVLTVTNRNKKVKLTVKAK